LIEYADTTTTMNNYELIRDKFLTVANIKAVLFYHNYESNSYMSLYTSNLVKPENLNEKQFENVLLGTFRKINANVIQVNVFPVALNQTYVGRIYLKNEQDGKDFIIDYSIKRDILVQHYKDKNQINFNINVDSKTLRKIKAALSKAN
jgi:hypothetical protein